MLPFAAVPDSSSSSEFLTLPFVPAYGSAPPVHAPSEQAGQARCELVCRVLRVLCPLPLALPHRDENAPVPVADAGEELTAALTGLRHILSLLGEELGYLHAALCLVSEENDALTAVIAADELEPALLPRRMPLLALRAALRAGAMAPLSDPSTGTQLRSALGWSVQRSTRLWACLLPTAPGGRESVRWALLLGAGDSSAGQHPVDEPQLVPLLQVLALAISGLRLDETLRERTRPLRVEVLSPVVRAPGLGRYREFFESSTDGIIVLDEAGKVVWLNRVAEQLTGYATAGLAGRPLTEQVPESQRERVAAVLREVHRGRTPSNFDLPLLTTSQETLTLSASTSQIAETQRLCVVTFRDVTERRLLEGQLRRAKEFLDRVIDSTVDGIVVADLRGRVRIFNQGASRITGYSAEEVVRHLPVWRLFPDREAVHIMAELRSDDFGGPGRLLQARRTILGKGGGPIPVALTAAMIRDGSRELATVGIFQDLRERLRMEESLRKTQHQLEQTQKQAVLVELAGTTAHELNQPLTSVMGYAGLLKQRLPTNYVELHRFADVLLMESEKMADIVRKIGRITLYETQSYVGEMRILDLNKSAGELAPLPPEPPPLPPEPPPRPSSDGPLFRKLRKGD